MSYCLPTQDQAVKILGLLVDNSWPVEKAKIVGISAVTWLWYRQVSRDPDYCNVAYGINPLNTELNPICQ